MTLQIQTFREDGHMRADLHDQRHHAIPEHIVQHAQRHRGIHHHRSDRRQVHSKGDKEVPESAERPGESHQHHHGHVDRWAHSDDCGQGHLQLDKEDQRPDRLLGDDEGKGGACAAAITMRVGRAMRPVEGGGVVAVTDSDVARGMRKYTILGLEYMPELSTWTYADYPNTRTFDMTDESRIMMMIPNRVSSEPLDISMVTKHNTLLDMCLPGRNNTLMTAYIRANMDPSTTIHVCEMATNNPFNHFNVHDWSVRLCVTNGCKSAMFDLPLASTGVEI